jgi:hypothetical protein
LTLDNDLSSSKVGEIQQQLDFVTPWGRAQHVTESRCHRIEVPLCAAGAVSDSRNCHRTTLF